MQIKQLSQTVLNKLNIKLFSTMRIVHVLLPLLVERVL